MTLNEVTSKRGGTSIMVMPPPWPRCQILACLPGVECE